jgi:glucose-1-phosphate adenylyltransferase
MNPNIVILAGGMSSRMKKAVDANIDPALLRDAQSKSKAMIGLGEEGRPFLDYLLANIDAAGYRDVVLLVGERDRSIQEHYGRLGNRFLRMSIAYAVQRIPEGRTKPLGTADAFQCALASRPDWRGTKVTVCNCDNLYSVDALRCLLQAAEPGSMIGYDRDALGFEAARVDRYAVLVREGDFLASIVEKPTVEQIAGAAGKGGEVCVSMNLWRFSYDLFMPYLESEGLHPEREEKELPSAVMRLVSDQPRSVRVYPRAEQVPDLTEQADIERVRTFLRPL